MTHFQLKDTYQNNNKATRPVNQTIFPSLSAWVGLFVTVFATFSIDFSDNANFRGDEYTGFKVDDLNNMEK